MSHLSEARYGRACLLLLNICPITLRMVIDDFYKRCGHTCFKDFLDNEKHRLFHLMQKMCCCRRKQSKVTPLNRSQWDSLYSGNSSPCNIGYKGDCPCQYDAKGITTEVMDVTMCCLIITNICRSAPPGPGINMAHIQTIRDVRNSLIHASSANLDEKTFKDYWSKVVQANQDLAKHVNASVKIAAKVKDLETREMNSADLGELRKLMLDQKLFEEMEEKVSDIERGHDSLSRNMTQLKGSVEQTKETLLQIEEDASQTRGKISKIEDNIFQTRERMIGIEEDVTEKMTHIESSVYEKAVNISRIEGNLNDVTADLNRTQRNISRLDLADDVHDEAISEVKERIKPLEEESLKHGKLITEHDMQLDSHAKEIAGIKLNVPYGIMPSITGKEPDVSQMKKRLIEISDEITKFIQVCPAQERGEEIPIELIYASVVIREDIKYSTKSNKHTKKTMTDLKEIFNRSFSNTKNELPSDFSIGSYEYASKDTDFSSQNHDDKMQNDPTDQRQSTGKHNVTDPDDIFKTGGINVRMIYLLGDAAHGKTVYCTWLLRKWVHGKQNHEILNEYSDRWEKELQKFDFVFLLRFRNVKDPSLVSVIDMICQDLFESDVDLHATIHHVLSSDEYNSLIIMDGLDEWNSDNKCRMPKLNVSSSVTCFISMRPWVFPLILYRSKPNDKVLEILGLSEAGMQNVLRNVLINRYKLKENSTKYTEKYNEITKKLEEENLRSLMKIPLLAVVCVHIWFQGKQFGESMSSFYAALLNMLIERANEKSFLQEDQTFTDRELPRLVSETLQIENGVSVLFQLGKVAFEGLLSKKSNLTFPKRELEKEIGIKNLQFALHVGLISQREAPSPITKNVNVHFLHKSVQEFLAAIHILAEKEIRNSLFTYLSDIDDIMELSNVILFICGMCPSLGSDLSKHVAEVADSDRNILEWRCFTQMHCPRTEELYNLQMKWYRELQQKRSDTPAAFYLSDVFLLNETDVQTVKATRELLLDNRVNFKSLVTDADPEKGKGFTNAELNNVLSSKHKTRSLIKLSITNFSSLRPICIPTLRTLYLDGVKFDNSVLNSPMLKCMPSLFSIELRLLTIGGSGLGLSPEMQFLNYVRLLCVEISAAGWKEFIMSLQKIQHRFYVELEITNVDEESLTTIRSSSDFKVIFDLKGFKFHFARVTDKVDIEYYTKQFHRSPVVHDDDDESDSDDLDDNDDGTILYSRM